MSEIWNLSTLCRCCHADGNFKSLALAYQGGNDIEIYENMLRETLGISMSRSPEASYTICDECIRNLRGAATFKNQVLMCEQKFKVYLNNEQFITTVDIKIEADNKDNDFDNADDYDNGGTQIDEDIPSNIKPECIIEVDTKHPIEEVKNENKPKNEIIVEVEAGQVTDVRRNNIINRQTTSKNNIKQKCTKSTKNKIVEKLSRQVGTEQNRDVPRKNSNISQKQKCTKNLMNVEKVLIETEQKSDVPNNNIRKKEKCTKNTKERKSIEKQDKQSLIIKVKKDTGTKFSCKECSKSYDTLKQIKHHINKVHPVSFKCEYCSKQLKSIYSYRTHIQLHTEKKWQCPFCPKKFAIKFTFKEHVNSHTGDNIYKCDLCEKEFKYKTSIIKHLKVHAGTNKTKLCDLCGSSFNDQSNLNAHIRTVHQKLRPFICKLCDKSYTTQRHLRDHMKLHDEKASKNFKCDICGHEVLCQKSMVIHRLKHENKFMCRLCPEVFDDPLLRRAHFLSKHQTKIDEHQCPLCGKIFTSKYSLNRHVNDHDGIKRFSCDVCGQKFSQKSVLNRHIFRKHNPDADINIGKTKCHICKQSFKKIEIHMLCHTRRLSACDICGKTYPDNRAVNKHKLTKHFGRSFDCDVCGKKYIHKAKLLSHKTKVHKIKIEKDNSEGS